MGLVLLSIRILRPQASKNYFDDLESSLRPRNIKLADFPGGWKEDSLDFSFPVGLGRCF